MALKYKPKIVLATVQSLLLSKAIYLNITCYSSDILE